MATKKNTGANFDKNEQTRKLLQESEERFTALFDSSSDGIFLLDQDGGIVMLNTAFAKMHGYTVNEIKKMGIRGLDTPETRKLEPERIQRALAGEPLRFEVEQYCKNGSIIPLEVSVNLITVGGKKYILAFHRDITERKKAEREIFKKNNQLIGAQKLAQTGSYVLDVPSGIWQSSEVLDGIFGINNNYRKDIDGWANLIHPDEKAPMTNYLKNEVLKKKKPFNKKYRIIRLLDGETRWVHGLGSFEFDPRGNIMIMLGTIQDITEAKLAEDEMEKEKLAIKESESKYRGLIENTPMCIKVFDKDGNLKFLNKGGRIEHGVKEGDDLLKWDWLGTVKPQYIPAAKKIFEEALQGKTGEVEFEHTEESAAHPWCHGSISPILDEKGKITSVLFYSTNITELKRNEIKAKESELMFKTLLNSLPLCIKWFDAKGSLISINKGGREEHFLTEMPEEEIKNWDYMTCIEPAYHKLVKEKLSEALKGKAGIFIMEHVPGTSISHWCSSELLPVFDINNKVKYVLFISRDVTAEKEEQGKKIAHAKELEKMNQLMIGRELKMVELKEKLKELELKLQIKK